MGIAYKDLPPALQKQLQGQLGIKPAAKTVSKGLGSRFLRTFAGNLLRQAILLPIVSALSIASMWVFHGLMKLAGAEGWKAIKFISKTYHTDPSEWGAWVAGYIEQMTGKKLDVKKLATGGARVLSDGVVNAFSRDIMDELLALIVPEGEVTEEKGMDAAAGYLSTNMQFQMSSWLLHMIGDVQSFGMFKSLKDLPNAISWSFGLGWLSWLVMGTPFQESIVTPMRWKFKRMLRSERITGNKIHQAYREGRISSEEWNELQEIEGWQDRYKAINYYMSEKDYSEGMLKESLLGGFMHTLDVEEELRKKGYSLSRAKNIINFWLWDRKLDLLKKVYGEYEDLYVDNKVTEGEIRNIIKLQGYTTNEADLLIDIANAKKVKARSVTKADVRAALSQKVIGIAQARLRLENSGFDPSDVDLLIRVWTKAKPPVEVEVEVPEVRLLSRSELERAFKKKVIGPTDFAEGLRGLGYSEKDVQIIIETATEEVIVEEEEVKVVEVVEEDERQRDLTKSELRTAFLKDVITRDQFINGLRDLNYSETAIAVIVETAESAKVREIVEVLPLEKELSKAEFQRAYLKGVITIGMLKNELSALGYSGKAIALSIELVEKQWLETEEKKLSDETVSTRKELQKALVTGKIDSENILRLLADLGYTTEGMRIVLKYSHETD